MGNILRLVVLFFIIVMTLACQKKLERTPLIIQWEEELTMLRDTLKYFSSDYEKTTFLRRYCGGLMDTGAKDSIVQKTFYPIIWDEVNMPQWFELFETDSLPVTCGVVSVFYAKILTHFGYEAYTHSFGWEDSPLVHTVTLVKLKDENKLIIQDAHLNTTFLNNSDNRPIDFFDLMAAFSDKKYENIIQTTDSIFTQTILPANFNYNEILKDSCLVNIEEGIKGKQKMAYPRSVDSMIRNPCLSETFEERIISRLIEEGKTPHLYHFYTQKVYGMYGKDTDEIEKEIILFLDK